MKEMIKNIRQLFYTQMQIDTKHEETIKLNEYITMEQEKIVEAKLKFDEDCDRFNRFVKDVDNQTEEAHKKTEEAVKIRVGLNEQIEALQSQIDQNERDWVRADEFTKVYKESQDFVEKVKALKIETTKTNSQRNSVVSLKPTLGVNWRKENTVSVL